ncbi:MAG TPA: anti-sigma factor, partial [Aeromicrobium sp.]|nr:anti-sigma factor [Aeromicrobium sp.]
MTTDIHSFGAPYALDAFDPGERARFEAHLEHCADCAAELPGFLATANRVGEAAGLAPPAELKARLMAPISQNAQERAVVTLQVSTFQVSVLTAASWVPWLV